MKENLSETISEQMEALRAEIKEITDNDDASAEDIARADTLLDEWTAKKADLEKAEAREAKLEEVMRSAQNPSNRESTGVQYMKRVDAYDDSSQRELARSLRNGDEFNRKDAISRAHAAIEGTHVDDASKEHMTRLVESGDVHSAKIARHMLLTGSERYKEEFHDYFKSNGQYAGEALRTAMSLTSGNGGVMSPYYLDPTIILTNAGNVNPLRQIARVESITSNVWHGVSSAGVTAEWTSEGTQAADASPTFVGPTVTAHKADAYLFGSYEMLADTGFDAQVGMLMADAKANLEATAMQIANTGATIPRGIVAAVAAVTASIVSSASTGAFVIGDLYNLVNALTPRSTPGASLLMNKSVANLIRQFDTSGSGALWTTLGPGTPDVVLGFPQYEASNLDSKGNGKNIIVAGDFQNYLIVDRIGMAIQYVPVVVGANQRPTGQAGFYAYWRVGADCLNVDAFRLMQLNQTPTYVPLA